LRELGPFLFKSSGHPDHISHVLCSILDEFCDGYPHNMLPTPGYWVECSRAISNQGSAWTNDERDLHEIDEGITDSPDESIRDTSVITDVGSSESSMPR